MNGVYRLSNQYNPDMADVHDKQTRSRNMAAIKNKNTKPEIWLRKRLHARGFRYRLNAKDLPGKPDLVLPKYKTAIFINGCFWHMHDCPYFKMPKSRTEWWAEKLSKNKARDETKQSALMQNNWRVLTIWECAIKGKYRLDEEQLIIQVTDWLLSDETQGDLSNSLSLEKIPPIL